MTDAKRRRVKVKTAMTKDEALNLAHALRDKIFLSYNLIQFIDESYLGSVKLPREGDWVGWIARVILDAANGENVPQEQSSTPLDRPMSCAKQTSPQENVIVDIARKS